MRLQRFSAITGSFLIILGSILFTGSLIMFGFSVAGTLFTLLPSKDMAGMLNRAILHKMTILQGAGLILLSAGLILSRAIYAVKAFRLSLILITIQAILFAVYAVYIQSQMNNLAMQINSFDAPALQSVQLINTFRSYHKFYSSFSMAAAIINILIWIFHIRILHKVKDVPAGSI
jgi:hypothetical protein